ncbi:right-handed parallel beta-helix repeat-containing protein [Sphingobium aquiterrae]|uniref:right-handed parallel beta-helix repeat-containing protein n=1 Tax=Sphingobium aquiterrae TaxID=2038656 RepID=UPI003018661C
MRMFSTLVMLSAAIAATAAAQGGAAAFTVAETGRGYARLSDAVDAIGDGQGTILIAPGTYRQCAVQGAGAITYRAQGQGTAIFDGVTCEGKAALVLRGRGAVVDGVTFQNMHVPDGNGSGIRLEHGNLDVVNSLFRRSEQGILTGEDDAGRIRIDMTTFQHLGRCDRDLDCAHSLYVGRYGSLSVTRTRFEAGDGGHYLKSRASHVTINANSFDDSAGHLTNYMIDLPEGAIGAVTGNEMVQGKDKDNWSAFIALGAEGLRVDSARLVIANNRAGFVPGLERGSTFVATFNGARPAIGVNRLAPSMKMSDQR